MEIKEYILALEELRKAKLDEDMAIAVIHEYAIDKREEIRNKPSGVSKTIESNDLATEKQISLLKKMKIEIPKGLTKIEASKLIKENLNKEEEY